MLHSAVLSQERRRDNEMVAGKAIKNGGGVNFYLCIFQRLSRFETLSPYPCIQCVKLKSTDWFFNYRTEVVEGANRFEVFEKTIFDRKYEYTQILPEP